MIFATLTLPLGALLFLHALQLLETWALQDGSVPTARLPAPTPSADARGDLSDG